MRKQTIKPENIIHATINLAAAHGLENLSTKKIAMACKISEGSIFNHFKNKKDLLTECLYYIDRSVDQALRAIPIETLPFEESVPLLWGTYFEFFLQHGDYAKYYSQFRHSSYYDPEVSEAQYGCFTYFAPFIMANSNLAMINTDIIWVFIIETTLNFVIRIVDGKLPCSDTEKQYYFNLILNGLHGALSSDPTAVNH